MKTKILLLSLISLIGAGSLLAQDIENDDMYFNAKDRAKLREARKSGELAIASTKKSSREQATEEEDYINPTDSYSARNINPEYTSRSNSQSAQAEEEGYFENNYQYNNQSNYNNFNNNFNNWYGSSWYRPNYWAPSIYAWNTPYYGYYDAWNSPWYDPYWSYNGWSSSFSFHYGNSWNYGWGGHYNYWNRPYYAFNSGWGWGPGFGYASNWYWNGYRYPNTIVIVNNGEGAGRGIAYGKRPTRGSSVVSDRAVNSRSRSSIVSGSQNRGDASDGRISNNGRSQNEYYNRTWRNSDTNTTPSYNSNSRSNTQQNRSSWNNSNNSSWERSSTPTYSPSRSSVGDGGGSRSPSSGSGSGSNGRSRGRN